MKISDEDLMAEKLGLIVLCRWCGKRIQIRKGNVICVSVWIHEESQRTTCDDTLFHAGPSVYSRYEE